MQGFLPGSELDHWQPAQVGCPALPLPHHPVSTEGHGPTSCQGCSPHAPTSAAQTASCLAGRAVMTTLQYSTPLHHSAAHRITPHHTTPHTTPQYITSHHITSHHITSHHITSHHLEDMIHSAEKPLRCFMSVTSVSLSADSSLSKTLHV